MTKNIFYVLTLILTFIACGKRTDNLESIKSETIEKREISEEELTEINLVIEAIITQKDLDVLQLNKNSKDLIIENLYRIKVIEDVLNSDDYILPPKENEIFYSQLIGDKNEYKPLFTSEDSLYIRQQNTYPEKLKINVSILEKVNTEESIKDKVKKNPNLYFSKYEISIPILSKDMQTAYVQLDYYCGFLCGQGQTIILKKIDNKWKIVEVLNTWIS